MKEIFLTLLTILFVFYLYLSFTHVKRYELWVKNRMESLEVTIEELKREKDSIQLEYMNTLKLENDSLNENNKQK